MVKLIADETVNEADRSCNVVFGPKFSGEVLIDTDSCFSCRTGEAPLWRIIFSLKKRKKKELRSASHSDLYFLQSPASGMNTASK